MTVTASQFFAPNAAVSVSMSSPPSIQDANRSLQLILSHHGHPTLPLVVTHLDPSHNHLIATLPLHSHSPSSSVLHHGPPQPATVAAVANATTALLPIFLHSTNYSPPPSSAVSPSPHHSSPPNSTMIPWSSISFDPMRPSSSSPPPPIAWLLQAHGSLQSIGRRQAQAQAHPATTLASVDVFLVDALGKHPAQLLVSSRVPAATLPLPPMVGGGAGGAAAAKEIGWMVGSKM